MTEDSGILKEVCGAPRNTCGVPYECDDNISIKA
jgi:hypothetical protein